MQRKHILALTVGSALLVAIAGGTYWYLNQDTDGSAPESPSTADTASSGALSGSATTPQGGAAKTLPVPVIVVIDRNAIMQMSSVGQDVARQVQAFAAQAKSDLAGQENALRSEGQTLQQQLAILSPDVKQKRIADFEARQKSLQAVVQRKDAQIKNAVGTAQLAMEKQLSPILKAIVAQRGANIVLDKQAVPFATDPAMDITAEAVAQLNTKLPSYKIDINAPLPAGAEAAAAPAQQ